MDFCPNPSISLSKKQEDIFTTLNDQHPPPKHENGGLSQLLSQKTNEGDENSEWLSVFVEECFSSSGNYILAPVNEQMITRTSTSDPIGTRKPHQLQNPTKKKRKKAGRSISKLKTDKFPSIFDLEHLITELIPDPDPPLLHQAHWLADSEPIFPIKHEPVSKKDNSEEKPENVGDDELSPSSDHYYGEPESEKKQKKVSKPRKCSHCQAEKTPLWRQGPLGKGTLCNACGVRWLKSGKLFPEYRPANSPTFVSDLHSNVLRKVLKMREARQGSSDYGS